MKELLQNIIQKKLDFIHKAASTSDGPAAYNKKQRKL